MNSKSDEILEFIYDSYMEWKSQNLDDKEKYIADIIKSLKKLWPECDDISVDDINSMINDINHALSFQENEKYIIEKNDNEEYHIIPFDSEHKGITEINKEFGGFIHQFIGIKEKKRNPNIKIQPLSLDYLFVSHQIFVSEYKGIWGFTGTVGTKDAKEILRNYYKIDTINVPHNATNFRKDLPSIIVSNIDERNQKIIEEIQYYNNMNFPILVIFEKPNEISVINTLIEKNIKKPRIITFNGKNLNKDMIEMQSGKPGNITLGTNFCGRGTSIDYDENFPLHVIITFGPLNVRALEQAYGRTGREGKIGSTRIICTKESYFKLITIPSNNEINKILSEYDIKKQKQFDYIRYYKDNFPWIFNQNNDILKPEKFSSFDIEQLNKAIINVNRRTAYNYNFPICMSIKTYHSIQLQKIYSLKNCPECKYTWILFQKYIKEFIFETWSLFINKIQRDYKKEIENKSHNSINFNTFFQIQYYDLKFEMNKYFPTYIDKSAKSIFLRMHKIVVEKWTPLIMSYFPEELSHFREKNKKSYSFYKTGFYPYEIKDESGSRAYSLNKNNEKKINFIQDPEISYGKFSITHIIDLIFEKICEILEKGLNYFFDIHLFIRRTLGGCEFGFCIDPLFEDIIVNEHHCLFDKTPLFISAFLFKSEKPIIAAILIIVLVFVTAVIAKITQIIVTSGPSFVEALSAAGHYFWQKYKKIDSIENSIINISRNRKAIETMAKIIDWLQTQIYKNLDPYDEDILLIMNTVLAGITSKRFKNTGTINDDGITSKIHIDPQAEELYENTNLVQLMIKFGILLCLLISAFIKKFKAQNPLKQSNDYQKEFKDREELSVYFPSHEINIEEFVTYHQIQNEVDAESLLDDYV